MFFGIDLLASLLFSVYTPMTLYIYLACYYLGWKGRLACSLYSGRAKSWAWNLVDATSGGSQNGVSRHLWNVSVCRITCRVPRLAAFHLFHVRFT